jgi:hypothetical protein
VQRHLDLDEGLPAAHATQHDPAARARGDVARAPARHLLAAHRLPGGGERGQIRGGLRAMAPADGRDEPEHGGRQRDQRGDGDRRPHGRHAAVVRVPVSHGPPPVT